MAEQKQGLRYYKDEGREVPWGPKDPEWLPCCEDEEGPDSCCQAESDNTGLRWRCTRDAGHTGNHAVHGVEDEMYVSWPQEEKP